MVMVERVPQTVVEVALVAATDVAVVVVVIIIIVKPRKNLGLMVRVSWRGPVKVL